MPAKIERETLTSEPAGPGRRSSPKTPEER